MSTMIIAIVKNVKNKERTNNNWRLNVYTRNNTNVLNLYIIYVYYICK